MNPPGDMPSSSTSWRRPAAASVVAFAVVILAVAAVGVRTGVEQASHPPTCEGVGFGCTPDPATTALLVGGIYGLPTVGVVWVFTWAGWVWTRRRSDAVNRIAAWWPVWVLAVGAGLLVVEVLAAAG